MQGRSLESFLSTNNLSQDEWERSGADWEVLQAIADHHIARNHSLCTAAEAIAGRIRTFPGVHSVRWRVKNADHLLEKIVRKKLEPEKNRAYVNINVDNYTKVVTDLVGVRALHLFKDECVAIDTEIRRNWDSKEVIIYIRKGEQHLVSEELKQAGGKPKEHGKGYRSVHYIIKTKPEKFQIFAEVQVRTLFEEGWSEIDHKVRYPNFSKNPTVELFLGIFNGLAGSADEMGSFVKLLAQVTEDTNALRTLAEMERDQALEQANQTLQQLEEARNDAERYRELNAKLKGQIDLVASKNLSKGLPPFGQELAEAKKSLALHLDPKIGEAIKHMNSTLKTYDLKRFRNPVFDTPALDSLRKLGILMNLAAAEEDKEN